MHPRSIVCVILAATLAVPLPAQQPAPPAPKPAMPAEQPAAPAPKPAAPAAPLKLVVLQGEGAINNMRAKTATQPSVEVRDEKDKPVPGAEVVFQLPAAGPGGVFHGWMRTQTARTDAQGQAAASGLTPNDQAGRFNIKVTATLDNSTGSVVIGQSNAVRGGEGGRAVNGRSGWWKAVVALGAAGAVGGVVAATRNGQAAAAIPLTPITITPGPISVGSPR
ncbi:MAG: hypothetical protein AAB225_28585 [Acidobacteriota bacterium]|mgnify:CR=1 FL=1